MSPGIKGQVVWMDAFLIEFSFFPLVIYLHLEAKYSHLHEWITAELFVSKGLVRIAREKRYGWLCFKYFM
jgi:hypothetical protein